MKLSCFIPLIAIASMGACTRNLPDFSALDETIRRQSFYDGEHARKQDSLRTLYAAAATDSLRWEKAYDLEKIFFYHDIDSCHHYILDMLRLHGGDARQRGISEACYSKILFRMDSLSEACRVLEQIDTNALTPEAMELYCFAGYQIYRRLPSPGHEQKSKEFIDRWWSSDSTTVDCVFLHSRELQRTGQGGPDVERIRSCPLKTPNDTAKAYYFIGREFLSMGDTLNAIQNLAKAAEQDMRCSVKAYHALFELARILIKQGDLERADRYMRLTLEDTYSSHYRLNYNNILQSNIEALNALRQQQRQKQRAYVFIILATFLLLALAIVSLLLLGRYSSRLNLSRKKLNETSKIKDNFLAVYMEKSVDYLNKVDEYRSALRRADKQDGINAVRSMLRAPSFTIKEFHGLHTTFDSTFLGIFPDFVEKVNKHMQEGYALSMPSEGVLSTELRILALIKMGITKRSKIAKVLNMSVTTVYSYHSNLQKHSLHPDASFDQVIAGL